MLLPHLRISSCSRSWWWKPPSPEIDARTFFYHDLWSLWHQDWASALLPTFIRLPVCTAICLPTDTAAMEATPTPRSLPLGCIGEGSRAAYLPWSEGDQQFEIHKGLKNYPQFWNTAKKVGGMSFNIARAEATGGRTRKMYLFHLTVYCWSK